MDQAEREVHAIAQELRGRSDFFASGERQIAGQQRFQRIGELQLVADRKLDVDALDAIGVAAEALDGNHDVFVDLERVGVLRDRGGAAAVEPELPPHVRRDGDKAFGLPRVRDAHDLRGGRRDGVVVFAHDVADEDHLRAPGPPRFRRVADRLHVALVEMLESRELGAAGLRVQISSDFHDRGNRFAHGTEEFEADGANGRRHAVQDERRLRDDAVAAFLLDAGKAAQHFVRHVLAETRFPETGTRYLQDLGRAERSFFHRAQSD